MWRGNFARCGGRDCEVGRILERACVDVSEGVARGGKAVKSAIPRDASQNVHLFDDAETKKNMRHGGIAMPQVDARGGGS